MASSEHFARRLYRCPPGSSTPAAPGLQPWAEWVAQQTEHWRRPRFQNWDVGSLCSGLGVCQLVGMALQKAVAASGVARVQIRHIFQAELSPSKRSILLARPGCAHLFGDISELEAAGQAYDYRCGEMRPIPRCDLAVCGFSCKDLSGLNTRPASIADTSRGTGATLQSTIRYIQWAKPRCVILENVKTMFYRRKQAGCVCKSML